jgi:hypothetical protein
MDNLTHHIILIAITDPLHRDLPIWTQYGSLIAIFIALISALAALGTSKASLKNIKISHLTLNRAILLKKYENAKEKMDRLVAPLVANEEHIRTYYAVSETPKKEEIFTHNNLSERIKSNIYFGSADLQNKADRYFSALNTYHEYKSGSWIAPKDSPNFLKDLYKTFIKAKNEFHDAILVEDENLIKEMEGVNTQISNVENEIKQIEISGW